MCGSNVSVRRIDGKPCRQIGFVQIGFVLHRKGIAFTLRLLGRRPRLHPFVETNAEGCSAGTCGGVVRGRALKRCDRFTQTSASFATVCRFEDLSA